MSLTKSDLQLRDVVRETYIYRNRWREICSALGVDSATIVAIGTSYRDTGDCYREGLNVWLRGGDRKRSELDAVLSTQVQFVDHPIGYQSLVSGTSGPPHRGDQGPPHVPANEGQEHGEQHGCLTLRRKKAVLIIGIVSLVAMLVLLLPLTIFSSLTGTANKESPVETTQLIRNTTILMSKFNTQYYEKVSFTLQYTHEEEPDVITCAFDCTNSEPRVYTALENHISSSSPSRFDRVNRRYVHIRETRQIAELIYLLENSSLLFMIENVVNIPAIQLHLLTSNEFCGQFYAGAINQSFQNFSLNEANNFTANFTVPSTEIPRYYCGVWVVDSSVLFDFTVQASIVTYDVNFYQQRDECCQISPSRKFSLTIGLSLQETYKCVLISQLKYSEFVDKVQVNVQTYFPSPIFIMLISFAIVIFIVLFVMLFISICICFCFRNPRRYHVIL